MRTKLWCGVTAFLLMGVAPRATGVDDWRRMPAPGVWEKTGREGLKDYNGFAWYRCFVIVPKAWEGTNPKLHLGAVDDCDETFGCAINCTSWKL